MRQCIFLHYILSIVCKKGVHWAEVCPNFVNRLQKDEHFTEINNIHRHEKVQCSHFPAKKVKVGQVSKLSLVDTLSCFLTLIRLGLTSMSKSAF